jgi:DedD protein
MTGIRDAERLKDKIEVSLDSRQIFFLFFGGAVVACLVFVLGVMVGKRLESRDRVGGRAATSASVDPLAALDELAADEQRDTVDDLAFPAALTRPDQRAVPLGSAEGAPAAQPRTSATAVAAVLGAGPGAAAAKPREETASDAERESRKKGKFTLQIASFQSKTEAESLLARLEAAGFKPYVVTSNVEGKGLFYRVRIGEFGSKDEATDAKTEFEKNQHIIAYLTKI